MAFIPLSLFISDGSKSSIAFVSTKLSRILSSTTPWTCAGWEEYDDDDTAQTTEYDCVENSATLVTLGESSSTLIPLAPTTQSSNSSDDEVLRPIPLLPTTVVDDRRDDDNNKSNDDNELKATNNGDDALVVVSRQQPQPRECCGDNQHRDNEEKEETNKSTITTHGRKSSALRPALRIKTQDDNYDTGMNYSSSRSGSKPATTTTRTSTLDYQTTIGGGGYEYETHRPRMIRNSSRNNSNYSSSSSSSMQRAMDSSSNRRSKKSYSRSQRQHHLQHHSRKQHKQHARSNNRSYTVQFDPSVIVISIPSHRDYTPQTRSALHSTEMETLSSIERNTKEFTYEGWDWKCVIEEEKMIFDSGSGKFIHPIYYLTATATNNTAATVVRKW